MRQPARTARWLLLVLFAAAAVMLPAACTSPQATDDAARPAARVAGLVDAQGDPLAPDSPINAADPSETPAPTATPRPTSDASLPPTPSPTPWPTLASIPAGGTVTDRLSEPSPDGAWRVRTIQHEEFRSAPSSWEPGQESHWGYHSQHLVSADGTLTHTVYADWIPEGLGAPRPAFAGWAPGGDAAYVYLSITPDGCPGLGSSWELKRVALPSGEIEALPALPGRPFLSPDGRRIAGLRQDGDAITLTWLELDDLSTHEIVAFPPTDGRSEDGLRTEPLDLTWAPDASAALVHVAHAPCSEEWTEDLIHVDLEGGDPRQVWTARPEGGPARAAIVGWEDDGTLEIQELGTGWDRPTPGAPTRRIDARTGEPRP